MPVKTSIFAFVLLSVAGLLAVSDRGSARRSRPAPELSLQIDPSDAALKIRWNSDAGVLRGAKSVSMQIEDGLRHARWNLTPTEISAGVLQYTRESPRVDALMRIEREGQAPTEEAVI